MDFNETNLYSCYVPTKIGASYIVRLHSSEYIVTNVTYECPPLRCCLVLPVYDSSSTWILTLPCRLRLIPLPPLRDDGGMVANLVFFSDLYMEAVVPGPCVLLMSLVCVCLSCTWQSYYQSCYQVTIKVTIKVI